ncbi:YihY/virulence factor BrkB family protein [Alteribacillus iranensis]|uniref:Membrane protein n=1 Tax=Alteribacillus iranensis TaxID=930128 RepID=A0A1I2D2T5_9BACI|nr:YihY/virulence factor BrkB family protein [Alteribacillus iranensis]SFE74795.1 membrane protein [Alteribacillus iranensis]
MTFQSIKSLSKKFISDLTDDRTVGLAAEQAFFYMLALFPMMILFLSILPYFSINNDRLLALLHTMLPQDTARMVESALLQITVDSNNGLLTLGIIGTIWSASAGVNAFLRAINHSFDVTEQRPFWKARLLSIVLTFGLLISFLLIFVLHIFGELIVHTLSRYLFYESQTESMLDILRWVFTVLVMISVLSVLYFLAPYKQISFREVLPGAIAATCMWLLISFGFSFYVTHFGNYSATYGSLGGAIVLMLWLFLTGLALVVGGELNAFVHRHKHSST